MIGWIVSPRGLTPAILPQCDVDWDQHCQNCRNLETMQAADASWSRRKMNTLLNPRWASTCWCEIRPEKDGCTLEHDRRALFSMIATKTVWMTTWPFAPMAWRLFHTTRDIYPYIFWQHNSFSTNATPISGFGIVDGKTLWSTHATN
jgi:hypothetical protein